MSHYLTVKQAANIAGVSESTIRRMEARGEIPSKRIGKSVRIDAGYFAMVVEIRDGIWGGRRG